MSIASFQWVRSLSGIVALMVGMLAWSAAPALAQEAGRVTGRVVNAQTGEPMVNAQVLVVGTNRGSLTDNRGNFIITSVPAGTQQVQVRSVGFRTATQTVQVLAGEAARVDFRLAVDAVALEEIVVTGQAGATARREIGTSIASIDAGALEVAPVQNFSELLQGRSPGVTVLPGGGKSGQGSKVVLRGLGSLSQSVQPIIYVDGVRIDNSVASGVWTGGSSWSGLDDINPADIERVEIVRGAAAATLYGTEASSGVIQIFTKRGTPGRTRWNLRSEYGINQTPFDWWDVSVYSRWFYDNVVKTGRQHTQQLSAQGGVEGFNYYASGTIRSDEGVLPTSGEDYVAFRANMQLFPWQDVTLNINTGYSRREVQQPQDANNIYGYGINGLTAGPRGLFTRPDEIDSIAVFQNGNRFTGGASLVYQMRENFSHRLTFGVDVTNFDNTEFFPYGAITAVPRGRKVNYRRNATSLNLDYSSSFGMQLTPWLKSNTSAGFQAHTKDIGASDATGRDFPAPGLSVVEAAAVTTGWEWRLRTETAGFFGEQQFGFNDLFFVRFGLRADAHSAFGREHSYQLYPKVDASWVLSDHTFWPEQLGTLRLRAAYGRAGQQPGAFDAVRTWEAVSALEGTPAVTTRNLGNPNLAPEVSSEFEAGFDAGFLNNRLNAEFNYYYQRTEGALFNVRYPPSQGFILTQLENVGEISNEGIELGLRANVIEMPAFRWTARANLSTNRNRVISLGGQAPLNTHWTQWIREGYPVSAYFADKHVLENGEVVLKRDSNEDPNYIGPAFPTRTVQLGSDFGIGRDLTLNILFDHKGGHFLESSTTRWLTRLTVPAGDEIATAGEPVANWCHEPTDPIIVQMCETPWPTARGNYVHPADFWRLREVALAYRIPQEVLGRVGASSVTFSLSGRNLWRSQKYIGLEAEANYESFRELSNQTYFDTPLPRQIVAGISVQF